MPYCERSDVEDCFGVTNVARWADLDNDEDATKITARITRAIAVASAEIDDYARHASYRVPLVTAASATPTTIENLAARMAGLWLYESRGVNELDRNGAPMHNLAYVQTWARRVLDEIQAGTRKLDALP